MPEIEALRARVTALEQQVAECLEGARAREELLLRERALEAINTGILITGGLEADTPILYANSAFLRIFGRSLDEVLGRNPRFMQGPGTDPEAVAAIRTAVHTGRPFRGTLQNYRSDGTPLWNDLFISPVHDASGRATHFVGVTVDVTAARQAEEQIRELNTTLEGRVSERTAVLEKAYRELDAFGFTLAHDLRAPLRAMASFATLLEQDHAQALDGQGRDYLRRMVEAATRMDRLIDDLLTYSRLSRQELHAADIDLDRVAARVLAELAPTIEARGANVRIDTPLGWVRGEEAALVLVLRNLLSNAIKFVAAGTEPRVVVRTEPDDGWTRLWVEDNGLGIPTEYQAKIFEVFRQLHGPDAYPGTGIGLALTRKAAEHLGGEVGVRSEPGRGSAFWVRLPRVG
jgi:PAS domain S-box-containing protein